MNQINNKNRTKLRFFLVLTLFVLFFIFIYYSQYKIPLNESCETLSQALDKATKMPLARCFKWEQNIKPLWVGGNLTSISNASAYNYQDYFLKFKGDGKYLTIVIRSKKEMNYEIGKFYIFDLNKQCRISYHSTFSGPFYDPNLDQLTPLEC